MSKAMSVQISANCGDRRDDTPPTLRGKMPAKAISRPSKRSEGARTKHPCPKPTRIGADLPTASEAWDEESERDPLPTPADTTRASTAVVVRDLRPRQVIAAGLLVSGKQGREVAAALNIAEETVSRWRQQVAFRNLMEQLLRQHIDSMQLSMVTLTGEAIAELHNLLHAFSDTVSLKACAVILSKAAPILSVLSGELRQPPAQDRE